MTSAPEPLRTTLICGFLGAGKTTFIKAWLQDLRPRTVVLVNEFGSLGMDGAAISQIDGLQVVELPGGCICCRQKLELAATVCDIAERLRPQRLFIEPSGVAEASEIIRVLTGPALAGLIRLEGMLTIVDAETFLEYIEPDAFGTFFLDQLCNADIILINKTDLVTGEHLQKVTARIQALNCTALVVSTSYGSLPVSLPENRNRPLRAFPQQPISWEYLSLSPTTEFTMRELENFANLLENGSFGRILRAKGVLVAGGGKIVQLQLVGRRWTIREQEQSLPSPRLTLIGFNLDRQKLQSYLAGRTSYKPQPFIIANELSRTPSESC